MTGRGWVADPSVDWRIALTARLDSPVDHETLLHRLGELHREHGWPGTPFVGRPHPGVDPADALTGLTRIGGAPVHVQHAGELLSISAHHEHVDGLGLLAVLRALTGVEATSAARGVGDQPVRTGSARAALDRLAEVAFRPPARVASAPGIAEDRDAVTRLEVDRPVPVTALVTAGVAGVAAYNAARGARTRRVAVSVGASRRDGARPEVGDHSALLRLRDLDGLGVEEVRRRLRAAAPEPPPAGERAGALATAVVGVALRVLGPRLGSTLLVSHLGEVTAAGAHELAFYPVTGGGSGISIGAVGQDGRTVLTARGRGRRHGADALAELLARVRDALP